MLAAAGATVAVALGIIGLPLVNACADDSRGVVSCLRDMADRKFDLPGVPVPGREAENEAVPTAPGPEVVVAIPPMPAEVSEPEQRPEILPASVPTLPADDSNDGDPVASPDAGTAPAEPPPPSAAEPAEGQGGPWLPPRLPDIAAPPPAQAVAQPAAPEVPTAPPRQIADVPPAPPMVPPQPPSPQPPALVPPALEPAAPTALSIVEHPATPPTVPEPAPVAAPPATETAPPTPDVTERPAAGGMKVAASTEPTPPAAQPEVVPPLVLAPTIDAIELDGDSSFISGSGPAGAVIRLYVDGELMGESPVENGRWLIETGVILDVPRRELRALAVEPETGRSLGDSVITVEIELPDEAPAKEPAGPPAPPAPVAPVEAPPAPEPAPAEAIEPAPAPAGPPAPQPAPADGSALPARPSTQVEEPAPIVDETMPDAAVVPPGDSNDEAPATLPPLAPKMPTKGSNSVQIVPPADAEIDVLPPAGSGRHEPATIELGAPRKPALTANFEPSTVPAGSPSVKVLRLFPFGDPVYGRFSGGQAIIRRGDTLWSLARRYYGAGIHYQTIFKANRDQIRRPSRIFPGQVFDLPLVTEE